MCVHVCTYVYHRSLKKTVLIFNSVFYYITIINKRPIIWETLINIVIITQTDFQAIMFVITDSFPYMLTHTQSFDLYYGLTFATVATIAPSPSPLDFPTIQKLLKG